MVDRSDNQKRRQSPTFATASLLLAVASLIWGLYSYYAAGKEKIPMYATDSRNLIYKSRSQIKDVAIFYKNKPVDQITCTNICFWNAGRETIDREDLPNQNHPCVVIPRGVEVLSVQGVKFTSESAEPTADTYGKRIWLTCEFLDRNDGFVVQILHTGDLHERWVMQGRIKGSRPIRYLEQAQTRPPLECSRLVFYVMWIADVLIGYTALSQIRRYKNRLKRCQLERAPSVFRYRLLNTLSKLELCLAGGFMFWLSYVVYWNWVHRITVPVALR